MGPILGSSTHPAASSTCRPAISVRTSMTTTSPRSRRSRPRASCPIFLRLPGSQHERRRKLVEFMQRLFGYRSAVDPRTCLAFLYGTGANGKTLISRRSPAHRRLPSRRADRDLHREQCRTPPDRAGWSAWRAAGHRFETEEGRRWAEDRIKALTGGEIIAARFMRQDFFEFTPSFKLVIAGNHKPGLRAVDEAIRRRFHLVPFNVTIPPEERDDTLPEKLKAEWPGILRWMVEGCAAWQREGLNPPKAVRAATAATQNEDAIGAWLDGRCILTPKAWSGKTKLFHSWKSWAECFRRVRRTGKALLAGS